MEVRWAWAIKLQGCTYLPELENEKELQTWRTTPPFTHSDSLLLSIRSSWALCTWRQQAEQCSFSMLLLLLLVEQQFPNCAPQSMTVPWWTHRDRSMSSVSTPQHVLVLLGHFGPCKISHDFVKCHKNCSCVIQDGSAQETWEEAAVK